MIPSVKELSFAGFTHPLVFQDYLVQAALLPVLVEELLALVGRLGADLPGQGRPVPAVRPQLRLHGLHLPVGPGGLEAALVPLGASWGGTIQENKFGLSLS